ncbi:hypothetical protein OHA17_01695 [Streptomyces sp. NBC_00212]
MGYSYSDSLSGYARHFQDDAPKLCSATTMTTCSSGRPGAGLVRDEFEQVKAEPVRDQRVGVAEVGRDGDPVGTPLVKAESIIGFTQAGALVGREDPHDGHGPYRSSS